jgi:HEAT repeat protein
MQIPAQKLLRLLQPDAPLEVRCAAALVLGELGTRDADIAKALCEQLADGEPTLRLEVIKAVGKLRVESALPLLLERLKAGGEEGEEAALAAAKLGVKGTRALQELMPKVAPGLRRYIAAALAAQGAAGTGAGAVAVLLDKDPNVVDAAARSLLEQLPSLNDAHRRTLADELVALLGSKKDPPPPATEAAAVRLLAALDDPKAAAVLWDCVLSPHPTETRVTALQALSRWAASPTKDQLKRLFTCAADPDGRVAAPALITLNGLAVSDRGLPEWLALLHAPDVAVRRLAVAKLGERDTPEVAEALLDQLDHPDAALRREALARLGRLEHGRAALSQALAKAETPDKAWQLARAQAPFAKDFAAAARDKLFTQACKYLEVNDRRADALLFLLREADAPGLRDRIEERAVAFRKKKDYETAILYLRLLTRDPACGLPVRFELAACELKRSGKELSAEARAADPALQHFINLGQHYEADEVFGLLEKARWLEPEDLYFLGFHLAEQTGRGGRFGAKVLNLVVQRSPKSKLGQAAKSKLKREGLE